MVLISIINNRNHYHIDNYMIARTFKCLVYAILLCPEIFGNVSAESLDIPTWNVSMFSRANCINNESITFEYLFHSEYWKMAVTSHQINLEAGEGDVVARTIYVPPEVTWRSAAVSWWSGLTGYWVVYGDHELEPSQHVIREEGWGLLFNNCTDGDWAYATDGLGTCKLTSTFSC